MLWDPALFVFLFYRSLAEREYAAMCEERRRAARELPAEQQNHGRTPKGTAEARAQAIWSRRADPRAARPAGAAPGQLIKLPRR
jgi:hypothetical protein